MTIIAIFELLLIQQQEVDKHSQLSQLMRLWYLSHRRPAKAQTRLRIRAVSPEPSLFAHMKYRSRRRIWPKIRYLALWMAAHACLKNEFSGDEKYHNLMSWLNCFKKEQLALEYCQHVWDLLVLVLIGFKKLYQLNVFAFLLRLSIVLVFEHCFRTIRIWCMVHEGGPHSETNKQKTCTMYLPRKRIVS